MNKIILATAVLLGAIQMNGQEFSFDSVLDYEIPSHEIRVGTVKLALGGIFEGGYEYIYQPRHGFGFNVLVNMDPKEADDSYYEDFALSPYYRFYFLKTKNYWGKGLFAEGFANFYSGREMLRDRDLNNPIIVLNEKEHRYFETALGLAIGQKWVYQSGFVMELKIGVGSSLLGNSDQNANFKGDLSLGYRF